MACEEGVEGLDLEVGSKVVPDAEHAEVDFDLGVWIGRRVPA